MVMSEKQYPNSMPGYEYGPATSFEDGDQLDLHKSEYPTPEEGRASADALRAAQSSNMTDRYATGSSSAEVSMPEARQDTPETIAQRGIMLTKLREAALKYGLAA